MVFNIIKTRAKFDNPNYYIIAMEAITNLDNIFSEYDREGRIDAELYNPKFAIGVKDNKETFKAFLTRYIATIAPLSLLEF